MRSAAQERQNPFAEDADALQRAAALRRTELDAVRSGVPELDDLRGHLYERYLTPSDAEPALTFGLAHDRGATDGDEAADPLAGLDPVCLMDVDPETARFTLEHDGRTYGLCGPGCRREFLEDPAAFLGVGSR